MRVEPDDEGGLSSGWTDGWTDGGCCCSVPAATGMRLGPAYWLILLLLERTEEGLGLLPTSSKAEGSNSLSSLWPVSVGKSAVTLVPLDLRLEVVEVWKVNLPRGWVDVMPVGCTGDTECF